MGLLSSVVVVVAVVVVVVVVVRLAIHFLNPPDFSPYQTPDRKSVV